MTPDWLTLEAVLSYSLQLAAVGLTGLLLPYLLRIRDPEVLSHVWHSTLSIALLFPLLNGLVPPTEALSAFALSFSVNAATATAPEAARLGLLHVLAAGTCLALAWRAMGLLRLRLLRRAATPLDLTETSQSETVQLARRLLPCAQPRCLRCGSIASPLVYGVFRPIILLPDSFFKLPDAQRRAVLVHEFLHVRRRDWLGLLWLELWRALLWFHPVVHLISHRLAAVREQAVDRQAIAITADRKSYLEALLTIARAPAPHDRLLAPLFLEKNRLKQRVQIILEEKPMPALKRFLWLAVTTAALFFTADWARDSFPVFAQAKSPEIYKVGENGVEAPRLLHKVEPEYTEQARDDRIAGTVVVSCEIHADGGAHNIKVIRGLGGGLNEKAIEAIESWEFKPAMRDGEPVAVSAQIEVNFRLLDKAPQGQ